MIYESAKYLHAFGLLLWFLNNRISIPYKTLNKVNVVEIKQLMAQGQKTSRILAWTF
jgi:23S rRNA A1618 N6-methylase RlmF